MRVFKGHGTENDFVLLPDLEGEIVLTPALVRALCDRHAGVGADGVLRVVRSQCHPESAAVAGEAPFFMDYRNADGSLAEMCGNGARVFLRYLQRAGLVGAQAAVAVATRGGIRHVQAGPGGEITVSMGRPRLGAGRPVVTAAGASAAAASAVEIPNPHVVVELASSAALTAIDLSRVPDVVPGRPDGQNVEFVVRTGPRQLAMRVHERGVGETRSCGTGICAAVVAMAAADGPGADGSSWQVEVPGGRCSVVWRSDGEVLLTGPAVLVAQLELDDDWLARAREG